MDLEVLMRLMLGASTAWLHEYDTRRHSGIGCYDRTWKTGLRMGITLVEPKVGVRRSPGGCGCPRAFLGLQPALEVFQEVSLISFSTR